MKALVLESIGVLPVYRHTKIASNDPSEKEYKVVASGLNHRDIWIYKGLYANISLPIILGSDGLIMDDDDFYLINPASKWGDYQSYHSPKLEILGLPKNGTFAESIFVNQDRLILKPKHLDNFQAAALPLAGLTAYRALFVKGGIKKGQNVLISGVGGGVATMALLFAIAVGANVYVSSSSQEKIKKAIKLGAIEGVDYTNSNWAKELKNISNGIDLIIDSAAGDGFSEYLKLANPGAKIVFYGGTRGKINNLNPQIIFWKQLSIMGTTMGSDIDFTKMIDFVNKNRIVPIVDKIFPLSQAQNGFTRMEKGLQFGKIIIDIDL